MNLFIHICINIVQLYDAELSREPRYLLIRPRRRLDGVLISSRSMPVTRDVDISAIMKVGIQTFAL